MKVYDINQSLKPPKGYRLTSLEPAGAYLKLTYHQNEEFFRAQVETHPYLRGSVVEVYLNDQGREVIRVSNESDSEQSSRVLVPAPDFEKTFGIDDSSAQVNTLGQFEPKWWKKWWRALVGRFIAYQLFPEQRKNRRK